jgi:hypothetical protein
MGTFAETTVVSYRLSFADQGKQTSVFRFRLQQTNGSLLFLFSGYIDMYRIYAAVCIFDVYIYIYGKIYAAIQTKNGSPDDFP